MTGGAFFEQFIEDYYAECEEHLAASRRVLIELEDVGGGRAPEPRLLRELFRSLHTLKGLSGMVGDVAAERVAHALEGSLRAAERVAAPLTTPFVDALFAGAELLERCVAARQAGEPAPDVEPVLADVARAAAPLLAAAPPDPTAGAGAPGARPPVAAESVGGTSDVVHLFEFVPSVELTQRGIGVDAIRTRLRSLGTLLDARPRMIDGGVAFDFRVLVPAGQAPDEGWVADGLRWSVEPPETPETPETPEPTIEGERAPAAPGVTAPGASVVRVDLARLDAVMRLVGDLVVTRSRLDDLLRRVAGGEVPAVRDALEETNAVMERQLRRLREGVMRIRLVPIGEVFERLRFAARDAIRESGKQVTLAFEGQATEIDKLVVDRVLEPLLHLVRNAVSHGIEHPAERLARGKPADGRLTLRATASGDRIVVEVADDGAGIDVARVVARARERGLLTSDETPTAGALLDVLSAPGFSTRDEADRTSGRGIGMDVVRSTVHALAGEVTLETTPGRGSRFVIELPLTLMIVDALLVEVGGQQMAVPQPALREILQVERSAIVQFERNDVIAYRDGVLPLVGLARLFHLPDARPGSPFVLVVGSESAPMGLLVDRLHGLREIVVHPVADPLVAVPGVAGATELGDGRVSLILDAAALLRMAHEQRERRAPGRSRSAGDAPRPARPLVQ